MREVAGAGGRSSPRLLGFAAFFLAACSGGVGRGPVEIEGVEFVRLVHGGMCPTGACVHEVTVLDDGNWSVLGVPEPEEPGGRVPPGSASRLAAVLEEAWEELTAVPFAATCPTAYDGPETVYTVRRMPDGPGTGEVAEELVRELSSCGYDLERPEAAPVMERLAALWVELGLPR